MLSRPEIMFLLQQEPKFEDIACGLRACAKQPRAVEGEAKKAVAAARKFNREVTRGSDLKLDAALQKNPDHLPWEIVCEANRRGFYTMFIPKIFGGQGYSLSCIAPFLEEISSACLAFANIIGVHYLGFTILTASWNLEMINRISREVAQGEKNEDPCLISLAITEPDAGTDVQNIELMDRGSPGCRAEKTGGGYLLNGTKIFISMGHVSTWHIVNAYTDLSRPSENTVMLAVKKGMTGFSPGKKEDKMGQKACPASELVFNNCPVPAENVCFESTDGDLRARGRKGTNEQILAYIWGASRMGVAAFGAGAARGAFEQALAFAGQTEAGGKLLASHEWCQGLLAEMYKNAAAARTLCMEANYANGLYGLWRLLNTRPLYYANRVIPKALFDRIGPWLCRKRVSTRLIRKLALDGQSDAEIDRVDGWASLAKFAATDAGVKNCDLALQIMAGAGLRHDLRAEKITRDAKLLQIYEGTNQINRINLFKRLIRRNCPEAELFS